MKAIALLLMSVLAYSYAQNCDLKCAAVTEKCGWKCQNGGTEIQGADVDVCEDASTPCGVTNGDQGTCTTACVEDLSKPVCADPCTLPEACTWTCQDTNDKEVPAGDVSKCTRTTTGPAAECKGSGDVKGTCKPACKPVPKSGSSRLELFAPLVVLGTLTKMCISP